MNERERLLDSGGRLSEKNFGRLLRKSNVLV